MPTDPSRIDEELRQEVRVAIALNGGVSLAIWMGGCAVELDAARRADRGIEPRTSTKSSGPLTKAESFLTGSRPVLSGDPPVGPRTIYNTICEAFGRVLVIDLMSGASAGGINGALLGCAIAHERRLQPNFLRTKWLQLGDLSTLLQRTSNPAPRSLMRGVMFHRELQRAFGALTLKAGDALAKEWELTADDFAETALPTEHAPRHPALIPQLDVTTTDLVGVQRTFADQWGGELVAREYRARFAFRIRDDYDAENLATAARSSASFPFAFEPWAVEEKPAKLARLPTGSYVIDGGLLDNAPIKAVLDLIPERAASRQVTRYVCYLNADPPLSEAEEHAQAAKGRSKGEDALPVTSPPLLKLAGKCIGLPRKAPFVDQLDAVERRVRLAQFATGNELGLLRVGETGLRVLAEALLPTYRRRRSLLSLDELFANPTEIRELVQRLGRTPCLPWVPTQIAQSDQTGWGWGLRPAQRVIHLLLDAVRGAVEDAQQDVDTARLLRLLTARTEIHRQLSKIGDTRAVLAPNSEFSDLVWRLIHPKPNDDDVCAALKLAWTEQDVIARDAVRAAARTAARLGDDLTVTHARTPRDLDRDLFGERRRADDVRVAEFVTRALHIEVIRRSFDDERDIDDAQPIRFVQLTPFTKIRIFTTRVKEEGAPDKEETPQTPEDKLAGIRLGHFAAFYRSAWRANDFMWGRLDASTRIVEVLVDTDRAAQLNRQNPAFEPWRILARGLLPDGCQVDDDRVWLVREVLEECKGGTVDDLRDHLTVALQQDLIDIDGPGPLRPSGALTKMLCARAVQLEILQDELKILDEASRQDRLAGATSAPLDLPLAGGRLHDAIMMLREKPTLPERLDARDKMEIGSTLGLRTATHVAFVTLAALRHAKIPFAKALYILRALLFPVMGAVSRIAWYRLVVVIGLWGAALYLTSRVLAMPSGKASTPATLGEAVSCPVLLSYAALLAVMGVVAMPALRAWAGGSVLRRVGQGVCAAILLAVGAGIVIGMALGPGHAAAARLLVTAGSTAVPPDVLKDALMAVLFGLPLARLLPGVRGKIADSLDSSRWTGAAFAGAFAVLMGWLVAWAMVEHVGAFLDGDGPWWKVVAAWTAFAAAPVAVGIYLAISAIADKVK